MKKIISLIFVGGLIFTGCGDGSVVSDLSNDDSLSEEAAKEMGENLVEEMMGGVDIEFAEEGSGEVVPWPSAMPSDVPEFAYGKIDASEVSLEGVEDGFAAIQFREVEQGAYAKYEQDLKNAGWEIITDSSWTDEHISAAKGSASIDVDVNLTGENTAILYWFEN